MSKRADASSDSTEEETNSSGIVITNGPQSDFPNSDNNEDASESNRNSSGTDEKDYDTDAVGEDAEDTDEVNDTDTGTEEELEEDSSSPEASTQDDADDSLATEEEANMNQENEVESSSGSNSPGMTGSSSTAEQRQESDEVESDSEAVSDGMEDMDQEYDARSGEPSSGAEEDAASGAGEDAVVGTEEGATVETEAEAEVEQSSQDDEFTGVDIMSESRPNSFNAVVEASVLKNAIDSVGALVDECKIRVSQQGIQIRAVDPANVAMVDLTLGERAFESLNADTGVVGISWDRFEDVIGLANKRDLVQLDYNNSARRLNVDVEGLSYTLGLINPDSIRAEPDIPDLDLDAELTVEESHLGRGVKAADMVSDHIRFSTDQRGESFSFTAEGDTDSIDLDLSSDDIVASSSLSSVSSLYSLDYVKDMDRAIPNGAEVTMELGEDFPVKLHFEFSDYGNTTYMLAPRVEAD